MILGLMNRVSARMDFELAEHSDSPPWGQDYKTVKAKTPVLVRVIEILINPFKREIKVTRVIFCYFAALHHPLQGFFINK